jgi:hypothetical protein
MSETIDLREVRSGCSMREAAIIKDFLCHRAYVLLGVSERIRCFIYHYRSSAGSSA